MQLINKIKLSIPLYVRPGDTLNIVYDYKCSSGAKRQITKKLDTFDEPETIDTVLVYRTESGEFGLKGGRALIIGEEDTLWVNYANILMLQYFQLASLSP